MRFAAIILLVLAATPLRAGWETWVGADAVRAVLRQDGMVLSLGCNRAMRDKGVVLTLAGVRHPAMPRVDEARTGILLRIDAGQGAAKVPVEVRFFGPDDTSVGPFPVSAPNLDGMAAARRLSVTHVEGGEVLLAPMTGSARWAKAFRTVCGLG